MHSSTAMSSARSSIASATRCNSFLRMVAAISRQALKASEAAVAARSISSTLPRATDASTALSTGDLVSKVWSEIDGTILPSIMCPMPSAFNLVSRGAARSRLAANTSFGVTLSMGCCPRFQSFVYVVAFPARVLVVDLHVERQRELAVGKDRIKIGGESLENMLAGLLAGCQIAPLAEAEHHVEKAQVSLAVGDGVVLASDGADADAAEREYPGLHRGVADQFDDFAHIDLRIEIGGVFDREMRHGRITPEIWYQPK